jgi:hypothetical protein
VYLELWKQYSAEITHRWDVLGFDAKDEQTRPQYLARAMGVERQKLNVTIVGEPHVPFWNMKVPGRVCIFCIVFLLVC